MVGGTKTPGWSVGRQLLVQYCQFATISLKKSLDASS
jgi:hypothetical protein